MNIQEITQKLIDTKVIRAANIEDQMKLMEGWTEKQREEVEDRILALEELLSTRKELKPLAVAESIVNRQLNNQISSLRFQIDRINTIKMNYAELPVPYPVLQPAPKLEPGDTPGRDISNVAMNQKKKLLENEQHLRIFAEEKEKAELDRIHELALEINTPVIEKVGPALAVIGTLNEALGVEMEPSPFSPGQEVTEEEEKADE